MGLSMVTAEADADIGTDIDGGGGVGAGSVSSKLPEGLLLWGEERDISVSMASTSDG